MKTSLTYRIAPDAAYRLTRKSARHCRHAIFGLATLGLILLPTPLFSAQFADVTTAAGMTDVNGYCVGAAWGDYNNDKFPDLYITVGVDQNRTNALYRNNRDGTFTRLGAEAGPITTDARNSKGCAWIDFNNDGHLDLFVNNSWMTPDRNNLYWNNGDRTFRNGQAGDLTQRLICHAMMSACADYDGDGYVDVYLAEGISPSSPPFTNRLYRATGLGTFTGVDFGPPVNWVNDAVWGDFDNDGDPDLYTCCYPSPSVLWRNDGKDGFSETTSGLPLGGDIIHAAWADYDHDGNLDIALCGTGGTALYRSDGQGTSVRATNFTAAVWGSPAWADYDNDGHPDLLVVGGQDSPRPAHLYHNNGDGTFSSVDDVFTATADNWFTSPWADYDNDGFMDVVFTHQYGRNRLYRNLGNSNHWIKFKLTGTASNRDAIGAKVRILATIAGQPVWQMAEVNGGYILQNDTRLHFGLGDATNVDLVRIEWPSGNVQELTQQPADQILTISEQTFITPARPSASLGGSVMLTRTAVAEATYQWRFEKVNLDGQIDRVLSLGNLTADQAGRYSVVVSTPTTTVTNYTNLRVDTTFTKVTTGEIVTDSEPSFGGSWADYDEDGDPDLYVVNLNQHTNSLYRNDGNGTFTKILESAALNRGPSWSGVWGDFDNDGDPDLFVVQEGPAGDHLLRNEGAGQFLALPPSPGGPLADTQNTFIASCIDWNRDGWLDLFVGCYDGQNDRLYLNRGDGTFRRLTQSEAGDAVADAADTGGGSWADYDNDGAPDLFVAMYGSGSHFLCHNDGQGRLLRVPPSQFPHLSGAYRIPLWGDYDNDGDFDLFESGADVRHALYQNRGDGTFTNVAAAAGFPANPGVSQGACWGDYDNDGDLDLFAVSHYADKDNALFQNQGDGTFLAVEVGSPLRDGTGREFAGWIDYDQDGFLDLFVACFSGTNLLYHNNLKNTANANHWLKIKLAGRASNASAIGAKVRVKANIAGAEVWQLRQVESAICTQDFTLHFGLGDATFADRIVIEWPSGNVRELTNQPADEILAISEQNFITPVRPSASLGGSVTLSRTGVSGASYQWRFEGADLADQTNRILTLANLTADQAGRYSVVVSTPTATVTNHAYLFVDTQFTQMNDGPVVTHLGDSIGCNWVDLDNDGDVDLVVFNGLLSSLIQEIAVYRNDGTSGFTRLTADEGGSVVDWAAAWGWGTFGDLDNDDGLDGIVVGANFNSTTLVTEPVHGLANGRLEPWPELVSMALTGHLALADYDRDGFLDLFLGTAHMNFIAEAGIWPGPRVRTNMLYHNLGGTNLVPVAAGPLTAELVNETQAAAWGDYDGDGDLDLLVTLPAYSGKVRLYENLGAGAFQRAQTTGLEDGNNFVVVPAWMDYDNDGRLDLAGSCGGAPTLLFHNDGDGRFTRLVLGTGTHVRWQPAWGDYDNDGWPDLFLSGDMATDELWRNNGDGTFIQVTLGSLVNRLSRGNGAAWGDYNNDGALDLLVTQVGSNFLYHNNGNANHWIKVSLKGTTSNRSAIGAKVKVLATIGGRNFLQTREITAGSRSQNDMRAHFGLGNATTVRTLRIEWPSGTVQEFANVVADQILVVEEPRRPLLTVVALGSAGVDGTLHGDASTAYELQFSDDLATWSLLTTVTTDATGAAAWSDPAPAAAGRFYQARRTAP